MRNLSRSLSPSGDSVKPPRNPMAAIRGFSGGGLVGETVNTVKTRQEAIDAAANYDTPKTGATPAPASTPAPAAPAAPSAPQNAGSEAATYAAQEAQIAAEQAKEAKARVAAATKPKTFLGRIGFAAGGKIEGPGTSTSDSIPAVVESTGEDIAVSDNERILSAKQDAFLEKLAVDLGFPSLEAMLESGTGEPVGPTVKHGTAAAAQGSSEEELKNVLSTLNQAPNPQTLNSSFGRGQRFMQAQAQEAGRPTVPVSNETPSAVAPSPKNEMARAAASVAQPAPAPAPAPAPEVVNPQTMNSFFGMGQRTMQRHAQEAGRPTIPVPGDTPAAPAQTPEQAELGRAAASVAQPPAITGVQERTFVPPPAPAPIEPGAQERTFQQPAPQTAAPSGVVRKGNSFSGSNLKEDMSNPLTSIDLAGSNASLAAANKVRQSILDENAGARIDRGEMSGILEDSGRAESQALMDKWGRESASQNAMNAAMANPKAAAAIAGIFGAGSSFDASKGRDAVERETKGMANQTARRGQDTRLAEVDRHMATVERGQDVTATTEAARIAGNPMDNAVKQASVDTSTHALNRAKKSEKLLDDMIAEQDPVRRRGLMDTLLASQGKNPAEHRYIKVEGGEEIGPDNFTKIKRPSGVYDTLSGRFISMDATTGTTLQTDPRALAIRANTKLSVDEKKKQLAAIGYK